MKKLLLSSFAFFREYLSRRKNFFGVNLLFFLLLPIGCFKAKVISPAPASYEINDYRTVGGAGQVWSNALIWQKFNGTSWNAAGADGIPGAAATVHINGSVDTGGSRTANKIIVEANAVLTVSSATTSTALTWVKGGGSLILNVAFTNNGVFEIENNGSLLINYSSASGIAPIWNGTEKFSAGSTVTIQNWNYSAGSGANRLVQNPSQISPNADGFLFGNLITSGAQTGGFYLIQGNQEVNFCKNNYTMKNTANKVIFTDGAAIIHIGGNMTVDGTQLSLSATAGGVVNVAGNLSVLSGSLNLNQTSNSPLASLNLKGNLFVAQGANLSSAAHNSNFNFTGTGDGLAAAQTVDVSDNSNSGSSYIDFVINNGAYVKLINRNWGLGSGSSLTINGGATLDFGFNDAGALNVVRSSTATGFATGQLFEAREGSTLKITSPEGIISGGIYSGNVRIGSTKATRIFSPSAHYFYIGKSNAAQITASGVDQVSGTGFPANLLSGKIVIDLDTKTSAADDVSFRAEGIHKLMSTGTLTILKGKVVDNAGNGFGDEAGESGNLTMMGGRYQIFRSDTQPPLGNAYNISGGVIEFAGGAAIVIRDKPYLNVEVSGTNVSIGPSKKGLELKPNGKFTVKKDAVTKIANEDGFSGGTATAINSTNNPTIILEDQSTIEYNRDGNQIITAFEPLTSDDSNVATGGYFNLKISGKNGNLQTGTSKKLASGNAVYVRNNVEVALDARLIIDADQTLTVRKEVINNGGSATNFIVENDGNLVQLEQVVNPSPISVRRLHQLSAERKQYNFVSSPVKGQHMKYIFGNNPANIPYSTAYNEKTDYFVNAKDADYSIVAKGFSVKEPIKSYAGLAVESLAYNEADYRGVPNNGDVNLSLDWTDSNHGYNLAGNPYPSDLDIVALYKNSVGANSIESTFYFWDNSINDIFAQMGSGYQGYSYAIFNAATGPDGYGIAAPGRKEKEGDLVGTKVPGRQIKVSQGFMVRALKPGASLQYKNSMRKKAPNNMEFFGKYADQNSFRLEMTSSAGVKLQNGFVYFEAGRNGFGIEDSEIPNNEASDAVFSVVDEKELIINGKGHFASDDKIKLGTRHFSAGNYSFKILNREGVFEHDQPIYLKDNQLNIITDLSKGPYEFHSETGAFNSRFEIEYRLDKTLIATEKSSQKKDMVLYRDGADVVIRVPDSKATLLEIYDLSGKLLYKDKMLSAESRIDAGNFSKGIYLFRVITSESESLNKKFLID
ncbi:T9SS type A sorting domain-containing protein [Kaistella daneshvariae]|nr:T9SS type A sorting domain-containing protein [Kaistella daneshvariae]